MTNKEVSRRVLIMAGGTGGHVMPALSIANRFREMGYEIHWLGTPHGIEQRLLSHHDLTMHVLNVQGFRKKTKLHQIGQLFKLTWACCKAIYLMCRYRYNLVFGLGGYVSVPGGIAAWLTRRPLVIHEQNAIPGLANRLLRPFARKTLTAFPDTFEKSIVTGNPLKTSLENIPLREERSYMAIRPLKILVMGGSLGAHLLNVLIPEVISLFPIHQRPRIWHQTGEKDAELVRLAYIDGNTDAKVVPFIAEMNEAYTWADLVIARSGAMTVSEISAAGIASILVPYPYAVDDHQWHNGRRLEKAGAAILIRESDLNPQRLYQILEDAYQHPEELIKMAIASRQLAIVSATENVIKECMELVHVGEKPVSVSA